MAKILDAVKKVAITAAKNNVSKTSAVYAYEVKQPKDLKSRIKI